MKQHSRFFSLLLIHYTIISGVLVFGIVVFYKTPNLVLSFKNDGVFIFLAPSIALFAVLSQSILFSKSIAKSKLMDNLQSKFATYQSAHIIRLAFLEVAALLNVAAAFITNNLLFLAIAGILLLVMLYCKPTKDKISTTLQLSASQIKELFD